MEIQKQKELLLNYRKCGESRLKELLQKNDSVTIALNKYRKELLSNRKLENDITLERLKNDLQNMNYKELKNGFEKIDLIYRTDAEIENIIHIISKDFNKIEEIYKEFKNGAIFNFTQLI